MPVFPDDGDAVPNDEDVAIGSLPNGLTYYVRENDAPGQRVQLRLVVRAGSLLEEPDQRGGAHYLEHMMFNGTAGYPENELIRVLQRFGSEFGPDINAYTNYDETVYELQVPAEDDAVDTAIDVLYEWASLATIDPAEVELERGVMIEEWRLRSQGFWGRYFDAVDDILLGSTVYAGQDPLGTRSNLDSITPAALRRFYDDWYRPDLIAVVAVGDFDTDDMIDLIAERFGDLSAPTDPPDRPEPTTGPFTEPRALVLVDDELPNAFVELNYPLPTDDAGTVGGIRRDIAFTLGLNMLITRLSEDALRGTSSYFDPSFAANPLVRAQRSPGLAASAAPDALRATAEELLTEVERAVRHGFTADELDRSIAEVRQSIEVEYASADSTQDWEYASRYVEHYLGGAAIPDAETSRELGLRLLDEVTLSQVTDTFRATISATEPLIIVAGPAASSSLIPTEQDVLDIYEQVLASSPDPRPDDMTDDEGLMAAPAPARIISRTDLDPLDVKVLEFENGAVVAFLPTDIAAGLVSFGAASPGGWSVVAAEDVVEAQYGPNVITRSGLGSLDQVELDRLLGRESVGLAPYIDITSEGFFGSAAVEDLEILLQLVHLYMTSPRIEPTAFSIFESEIRPIAENPDLVPSVAVFDELVDIRYGDEAGFSIVPTPEELDGFDLARALALFEVRFADAGDFVFAFAGDVDDDTFEDLVARYIGTIPGGGTPETWIDVQPDPPPGVVTATVEAGTGELGGVTFLFTEEVATGPVVALEAAVLGQVLNQRLTERIREELSATYSPFAAVDVLTEPDELIEVFIEVSADPAGLAAVSAEVLADLDDLRRNGPSADELAIAQEQLVRQYELVSNEFWVDTMLFYLANPDEDPADVFRRIRRVEAVTADDVRDLARLVLPPDHYIEIRLVPRS